MISKHIFTSDVVSGKAFWLNNLQSTGNLVTANSNFTITNDATILGDLTVKGSTTTIDTVTLTVDDHNIELGSIDNPTDSTADGGGITLKGATDKTFNWSSASNAWESNVGLNVLGGYVGIGTSSPDEPLHIEDSSDSLVKLVQVLEGSQNDKSHLEFFSKSGEIETRMGRLGIQTHTTDLEQDEALYLEAYDSNNVMFRAGGNTRMLINNDGNVGIGTTNPGTDRLKIVATHSGTGKVIHAGSSAGEANGFVLQGNGNVGIGTTNPTSKITAISTVDSTFGNVTPSVSDCVISLANQPTTEAENNHASLQFNLNAGTHNHVASISLVSESAALRRGALAFCTDNGANRPEVMRIDSDGHVGIGTTNPSARLHITDAHGNGSTSASGQLELSNIHTNGGTWGIHTSADGWNIGGGGKLGFFADDNANQARMVITQAGNVGIGTTNPSGPLHVYNTAANQLNLTRAINVIGSSGGASTEIHGGALAVTSPSMGGAIGFTLKDSDGTGSGGNTEGLIYFKTKDSGSSLTEKMRIDSNGNVGIGTTSPAARLTIAQPGTTIGGNDISKGCFLAGSSTDGIGIDDNEIVKKGPSDTGNLVIGNANANGEILLRTNLQDRLVISNSGASLTGHLTTSGAITVNNSTPVLVLRDTNGGDTVNQNGFISYRDNSDTERGYVGFGSIGTKDFTVSNKIGDINLNSKAGGKVYIPTSLQLGNGVTLAESSDRADMLKIQGITSSYAGVVISNTNGEDSWSLMADGDLWGVYNDTTNEWHIQCNDNGAVELFYNNGEKLTTSSSGISINGNIDKVTDVYVQDQIIHHEDTDTYMQFHAANQWRVVAGGEEVIECQSTAFNVAKNTSLGGTLTVAENSSFSKNLTVGGNLNVNGTVFTINSTTVTVDDKNIELGSVASPTNDTADGGGITLKGATDKTISWSKATTSWNTSENLGVADGKYVFTDKVRARDAAGLLLQDDSGNGITIFDGGNVSTSSDFAVGNNLLVPGTTSLVGNVVTTNNLTVGGTSYFSDSVTIAPNKTLFAKGGLSVAGTSTFNDNVTIANNKYIATDKVMARDSSGLSLVNDAGQGISISDTEGRLSTDASLAVGESLAVAGATSLASTLQIEGQTTFIGNVRSFPNTNTDLQGTLTVGKASTFNDNVTIADNKYITTDKIVARDSAGLALQDDGGNGITINNGGNTSVSHAFLVGGNTTIGGDTSIAGTTYHGGAATFNDNVTINSSKTFNVGNVNIAGSTTFKGETVFEQNVVISGDFNVTSETPMTLEQGQLEIQTLTSAPQNTTNQLYNLNNTLYWNGVNLLQDTNTFRPIHDSPVNGATTTSISSNWAFDNVKTAVPANAIFTDTNTTYSAGNHLDLNSTTFSVKRDLRGLNNGTSNGVYVIGQDYEDFFMIHGTTSHYADWYQGSDLRMRLVSSALTAGAADLHVEGDVLAFSTTVSDKNFKDNINTIDNALYKVNKLRGVEFEWNSTSRKGEKDIGVVAQEVEKVLPEIVREKSPCVGEFCENTEKYKTVDYQKLTAVLIEAVKELSAEVEDLKKKLS